MTRLSPIPARELCRKLSKLGFELIRQKGNHAFWRHKDGRTVVVPVHKGKNIGKGLFRTILSEIEVSFKDFEKL